MKTRLTACLLSAIALCVQYAHADTVDGVAQKKINDDLSKATTLARASWDLAAVRKAYEAVLFDIQTLQMTDPDKVSDLSPSLMANLRRRLLILDWEEEQFGKPDDPHGVRNVADHIQRMFQGASVAEQKGDPKEAAGLYWECTNLWSALSDMHPEWETAWVQQQALISQNRAKKLESPAKEVPKTDAQPTPPAKT